MLVSPTRVGSSAAVFFCGMPIAAVGPVADTMRPIFTCADALASGRIHSRTTHAMGRNKLFSADGIHGKTRMLSQRRSQDKPRADPGPRRSSSEDGLQPLRQFSAVALGAALTSMRRAL